MSSAVSRVVSQGTGATGTIEWHIKDFKLLPNTVGQYVYSPPIDCGGYKYEFKLFPGGDTKESDGYVGLYLKLSDKETRKARTMAEFQIISEKNEVKHRSSMSHAEEMSNTSMWGWTKFMQSSQVYIQPDGSVLIRAKLTIHGDVVTCALDSEIKATTLAQDMRAVFESGQDSDMTMHVGDVEIPVHRFVLKMRSPVFAGMLRHDMVESKTNTISIDDVNPAVMRELVRFMYTDTCKLTLEETSEDKKAKETPDTAKYSVFVAELLAAANRYDVKGVVEHCASKLRGILSCDTFCSIYELAHLHNLMPIKEICHEWIRTDVSRFSAIMETPAFGNMSRELLNLLLKGTHNESKSLKPVSREKTKKKRPREDKEPERLAKKKKITKWTLSKIKRCNMNELMAELKDRNQPTNGLKTDLIQRLFKIVCPPKAF